MWSFLPFFSPVKPSILSVIYVYVVVLFFSTLRRPDSPRWWDMRWVSFCFATWALEQKADLTSFARVGSL